MDKSNFDFADMNKRGHYKCLRCDTYHGLSVGCQKRDILKKAYLAWEREEIEQNDLIHAVGEFFRG